VERFIVGPCAYAEKLVGSPRQSVPPDRWGETLILMDGEPFPPSDAEYPGMVAIELTD
jgi:hypothetical protein